MLKQIACGMVLVLGGSWAAVAADCGEPPLDAPNVPVGESATSEQIRIARDAVLAYSSVVDEYIACMDSRSAKLVPYMTKEQISRRQEDINELHNTRRDIQIKLNEAIRAFRRQTSNS